MPIPRGTECYNADCSPVAARGLAYSEDELETALSGPVSAILRDDAGNEIVYELLTGVAETDFQKVLTVTLSWARFVRLSGTRVQSNGAVRNNPWGG